MLKDEQGVGNPKPNGNKRLIVLSGCSGGGKSSLLDALAARGHSVQPEAGRRIVKEQLLTGGDALPWSNSRQFVELAASRAALQFDAAVSSGGPVFFDRSLVDVVSYLEYLGLETPDRLRRMLDLYRYAPGVFVTPPWREIYRTDNERRKSFDEAVDEYHAVVAAYRAVSYEIIELPRTSVAERVDFLEKTLAPNL